MAKKKKTAAADTEIIYSEPMLQPITETIEKNYMPYVMSVIISRAIPEIDGLKPSHRKLLYTMYTMGLLGGNRTKSANIVGQTMKLNPHGDAAIYETLVRLTRDNATLLHPFIDSKGNFGKQYSSDMQYAASRYTECRLEKFCEELFRGIDKNAVDMIPNYDGTMNEPALLPTTFPNVLVTPNTGIAVGMASNVCSFNLAEICDGTIALLKNPKTSTDKIMQLIKAPDFSGGGEIIYDEAQIKQIYETGSGSVRIRSVYSYDKKENCIDVLQIPYSTSIEQIMKKIGDMIKEGKLREVTDFRDEIDLDGFKLTLDLRRGVDPDKLMKKLFKSTPLEDSFKCNFNILVNGVPRQMGIVEILTEWIAFRIGCVRRELTFDLDKKKAKLHLLLGLGKILLDIDKAIRIIRQTEKEEDVIPNLEEGFSIDKIQAEYIADIKLRNLNREYILNRIREIEGLQADIAELEEILGDEIKVKNLIIKQLQEIKKKYGKPRLSSIIYSSDEPEEEEEETVENYNVQLVLSKEGYFKKITFQSLKGNDEQKFKEGDELLTSFDSENISDIVFFTNRAQVYRSKVSDFECTKASAMGDFLPAKLEMENGEKPIFMRIQNSYPENENFIFLFRNGKGVRVPASSYQTKGNRRKLIGAYSDASPIVGVFYESEPVDILLISSDRKAIVIKSSLIPVKATRSAAGVNVFTLKKNTTLVSAEVGFEEKFDSKGFKKLKIPASGVSL
ncbi:MAG: DNA topoisomerase (ATP-hydrolyzing) subunit A [Clostridia bacterium]|nr:DNA topoisomerase (ATP-hydrolyzing) subunit A [Clostridia bacterium]